MQFPHRITRYLLALITALVLAWSGPVWAQSKEMYAAKNNQCDELMAQAKYAEAIPYAKRDIELARQEFGETHQHYATGLNNLRTLYGYAPDPGSAHPKALKFLDENFQCQTCNLPKFRKAFL